MNTRGIGYNDARRLLLAAGTAVLVATAAIMFVRRVDTVEVVAVLLFMPIFVAFVFWNVTGGVLAAVLAALAYTWMRFPAIDAVGAGRFSGLILSRTAAFVAFGAIGGWASRQLEASLVKLDLYDQIDDLTGLNNARFFVHDTELELARCQRYQSIFSVALVDVDTAALEPLGRRQRGAVLRDLGRLLRESVRTVDRPVHARDDARHRLAVVLPETGPGGAEVFADRLAKRVAEFLAERGAPVGPGSVSRQVFTLPEDQVALQAVREEFMAIDQVEHPAVATYGTA